MTQCTYCKDNLFSSEYYVIRKAVKPKHQPYRWKNLGICCESCYDSGKKVSFEYGEME